MRSRTQASKQSPKMEIIIIIIIITVDNLVFHL